MATAAVTIPRPKRRPRTPLASGRACVTDIYYLKHIDNSRLQREVDREKRRECFGLLGLAVVVFLFSLLISWQHFLWVRDGYQIEELKAQRSALAEWNRHLRLEQAALQDPQRVDTLARQELGLVPPDPQQVIRMGGEAERAVSNPEWARNFSSGGEISSGP